jgi:hypothetical protein
LGGIGRVSEYAFGTSEAIALLLLTGFLLTGFYCTTTNPLLTILFHFCNQKIHFAKKVISPPSHTIQAPSNPKTFNSRNATNSGGKEEILIQGPCQHSQSFYD